MSETYELKHPFTSKSGDNVQEITVRRPKAKDLVKMDEIKGQMKSATFLAASLTGLSVADVHEMDAEDFAKVNEIISDFLGISPEAGEA